MDKGTALSWIICGKRLFVWNYLSPAPSKKCIVLDFPPSETDGVDKSSIATDGKTWMVSVVDWDSRSGTKDKVVQQCKSAGIIMLNKKTGTVIYWPDIYFKGGPSPVVSHASYDECETTITPGGGKTTPNRSRQYRGLESALLSATVSFNSLITSAIPVTGGFLCFALACCSSGEVWQFQCSPSGISQKKVPLSFHNSANQSIDNGQPLAGKGYPRSVIWRFRLLSATESSRQFFLLTDHEIHCFNVNFTPELNVSMLWSHEIIGTDSDLGVKKDLAGQKQIWPVDMQVDEHGKELMILIATFCKDRMSSSSYTQYSILTMQYKLGMDYSSENIMPVQEKVLEKKCPIQVIIPKARVEDEDFLFSMRLRAGGKPSGSAIILSGDGTATVSNYWRNSTRLYQFDLPWDAGRVLDASVFPSTDGSEDGAWVVLTEQAGVWAIPEKAVILGGVEPPERSVSHKGSSNEGPAEEERKTLMFGSNVAARRTSSDARDAVDGQKMALSGIARRSVQDEESEALLGHLFHDFLLSGDVDSSLEKLRKSGSFEKDGETNVFARTSKSIIDTLAKHWTTTRGAEIVAMAVMSSQLLDKQQKHQRFLQFLALSKCHEELSSKQRYTMQTIMEHGEKLAGMIQLRELQNLLNQNSSDGTSSASKPPKMAGSLWDLIQLVGERARRNTVLLMDRDNGEVFYSKVSDLEQVFYCLSDQLEYIISGDQPYIVQIRRACELSNACTTLIHSGMRYRNEHHTWYPSLESLTPWYCQLVVRNGLWSVADFMLQLLKDATDLSAKSDLYSHLEGLANVLLETYSGAITAKLERGEEHKGLLDEYWNRRDVLLDSLYQLIKGFAEARYQHESLGPRGGFSYYVFEQLYQNRQFGKLLRLGEEFQEELVIFLKQHKDLLWLHEMFLNQFSSASVTLHALALFQEDDSAPASENGLDIDIVRSEQSLADRKRLLRLSKIAALAGRDSDFEIKTRRIDADLKILMLQEVIVRLLSDNEEKQDCDRLLPPGDLIELCLESQIPELSLLAFDVFAWTSSSFRKSNRSLLEECWKNAADQDDWGKLYQASMDEGWSDEMTLRVLRETVLFQAANKCYGPEAETYSGFEEVMPLQRDNELSTVKDNTGLTVEGILMQHKRFPEAGKLMLTAINLGKLGAEMVVEEDGPTPMD
ncbi:hypothetical protein C5167_009524 [Papaver somniferum]|uniref:Nucleoporin Nup133/Nup155-like N-terminal domain-containing protein n=1 Tax=Papaver somniferum TaxID=3469 RepID=A0A4Y7K0Q9_PAPSO|nr:hypothetical protein C5167_009524 [Papaver somniferum]